MKTLPIVLIVGFAALLPLPAAALAGDEFVPFVIPAEVSDKSLIAFASPPAVAADGERVVARGGHFWLGKERFRAWGVNFCFAADYPTHDDAKLIARRLAAFGINAVRLHHTDSSAFPRGIWDPKDNLKFSAEALDRLDFFIDQLAKNGIRCNLNLHVSRSHAKALRLPDADKLPTYDCIADLFTPELIDAHKKYARDLLTHVNAYRKVRYADDPAIAFIEITNEDSFFRWSGDRETRSLPPYYAKILQEKFNAHLKATYNSTDKLAAAWNKGAQPLGENMLPSLADRKFGTGIQKWWVMEMHEQCKAQVADLPRKVLDAGAAPQAVRITIDKTDPHESWHLQFKAAGLTLKAGQYYTLTFKARADKPRPLGLEVGQSHEPWKNLGLSRVVNLTADWQTFRAGFTASATDDNARVCLVIGGSDIPLEIEAATLCPAASKAWPRARRSKPPMSPSTPIANRRSGRWTA